MTVLLRPLANHPAHEKDQENGEDEARQHVMVHDSDSRKPFTATLLCA